MPVRTKRELPFLWVVDAFVAFFLWLLGVAIAGVVKEAMPFLGPIGYPTGVVIGLFPVGIWASYCGVAHPTPLKVLLILVGLMGAFAIAWSGFARLPYVFGVFAIVLPLEIMLGKLFLSCLAGSSWRYRQNRTTDCTGDHDGTARDGG